MAKFKVGDRVRVIYAKHDKSTIGKEATVTSELKLVHTLEDGSYWGHNICIDNYGSRNLVTKRVIVTDPSWIAPLTPPAVDTWATEQVKKWTKPEPVMPDLREKVLK